MRSIEYDKVYEYDLAGSYSFGTLPKVVLEEVLKDGRVASHMLEPQIEVWFPELKHVKGCKGHDHIHRRDGRLFDAKNFTRSGGCKFMPSNMLGTGRKFDQDEFVKKTSGMSYIICDIVDFPRVRIIFKDGKELAQRYPKGNISKTKRGELFGEA